MTAPFERIDVGNATVVVACSGEIDLSSAKELRGTLLDVLGSQPDGHLVVDLTDVSSSTRQVLA